MAEKTQPEVQARPQVNPEKLKVLSAVMDKIEKDFGKEHSVAWFEACLSYFL